MLCFLCQGAVGKSNQSLFCQLRSKIDNKVDSRRSELHLPKVRKELLALWNRIASNLSELQNKSEGRKKWGDEASQKMVMQALEFYEAELRRFIDITDGLTQTIERSGQVEETADQSLFSVQSNDQESMQYGQSTEAFYANAQFDPKFGFEEESQISKESPEGDERSFTAIEKIYTNALNKPQGNVFRNMYAQLDDGEKQKLQQYMDKDINKIPRIGRLLQ